MTSKRTQYTEEQIAEIAGMLLTYGAIVYHREQLVVERDIKRKKVFSLCNFK